MGDDESFRVFVQRQWGPLVRTAFLLTGDRGHAEDLVQAALEKTHRRWDRVSAMDAPVAYVRRAFEDLAEADVAHALGCSIGSVKSQASRGLDRLRAQLGPTGTALDTALQRS